MGGAAQFVFDRVQPCVRKRDALRSHTRLRSCKVIVFVFFLHEKHIKVDFCVEYSGSMHPRQIGGSKVVSVPGLVSIGLVSVFNSLL